MSYPFQPPLELEPVHWQHQLPGELPTDVTARLLTNANNQLESDRPAVLTVPGYGEGEWAANQALDFFTRLGRPAIVSLVDTTQTPASLADVTAFATDFVPQVVSQLQEREALPAQATVLGHSMGGGLLGIGVQEAPELFGSLAFLEPIGHDTAARIAREPDYERRVRAFKRQFAHVLIGPYPNAGPSELAHAGVAIGSQLKHDLFPRKERRFDHAIRLVQNTDVVPAVYQHAKDGNAIVYIFGSKDPLVKLDMVLDSYFLHAMPLPGDGFSDESGARVSEEEMGKVMRNIFMVPTIHKHAYMGWGSGKQHLGTAVKTLDFMEKRVTK